MLSKNVQQAIDEQINAELSSSYTYLAMSIFCQRQNFIGCAHWLRVQSEEEYGHGMRLLDFLLARDGEGELKSVTKPDTGFASIASVFEQAFEQEQQVSKKIDDLYELALKEKAFSALVSCDGSSTSRLKKRKPPARSSASSTWSRVTRPRSWTSTANWVCVSRAKPVARGVARTAVRSTSKKC